MIINIVRDELAMCSFLMEEAKSLRNEEAIISALGTLVAGLCEYVCGVRSITATLGDLLGVDVNVDPARWSKDISVAICSLQVEELWTRVEHATKELRLLSHFMNDGSNKVIETFVIKWTFQRVQKAWEGRSVVC